MDLVKIGAYIAAKRKSLGLTQRQVAEKLGMSDKSVSKWERGICLPDVAYLYRYEADAGYRTLDLELTTYQKGREIGKPRKLVSIKLDGDEDCTGTIAIVPDFQHYRTKVIYANGEGKYQTEFSILDDVDDREYYGRAATEIADLISLKDGKLHGILALFYAKDELQAIPVESLEADGLGAVNDYVYYLSVRLCK